MPPRNRSLLALALCTSSLIAMSWGLSPPAPAAAAGPGACIREYRDCVESGAAGCDGLLADCTASCELASEGAAPASGPVAADPQEASGCSFNPCGDVYEFCDPDKQDDLPFPCPRCTCSGAAPGGS
jgi:hypothetical protein